MKAIGWGRRQPRIGEPVLWLAGTATLLALLSVLAGLLSPLRWPINSGPGGPDAPPQRGATPPVTGGPTPWLTNANDSAGTAQLLYGQARAASPAQTPSMFAAAAAGSFAGNGPFELSFDELYAGRSVYGLTFSEKLTALNGKLVVLRSFMAPPLKPEVNFFVATREPLALCPFCSSDASWPTDIIFVRMPPGQTIRPTAQKIRTTGRLEIGRAEDAATGFVSLVRIVAERVELLP